MIIFKMFFLPFARTFVLFISILPADNQMANKIATRRFYGRCELQTTIKTQHTRQPLDIHAGGDPLMVAPAVGSLAN